MTKQLTKAEEQIMQILWQLKTASVKDIIEQLPKPKPATTTVSTIIRILESKKYVTHKTKGRGFVYFPVLEKEVYSNHSIQKLMQGYFGGSFKNMVSFFIEKNNIDIKEFENILKELNKKN